jgi:hypothetical protein
MPATVRTSALSPSFTAPLPVARRPGAGSTAGGNPTAIGGAVKSLTVKLEGDTYTELRAYCCEQKQATGSNRTHQQVIAQALKAFLPKRRVST